MAIFDDRFDDCRIYVYKLVVDNGGAPCIHGDVLSLSICKPRIRVDANMGDWVVGFGGKSSPKLRERLIYIAKVTEVAASGEYYRDAMYHSRPDCIYRATDAGYEYIEGSQYHSKEDLEHDLGVPHSYGRARSLLSKRFAYFGNNHAQSIASVSDIYHGLPRDYVKNHDADIRARLERFISDVIEQHGYGKHGEPTHLDFSAKCYTDEDPNDVLVSQCKRC